ncbi:MAG: Hsp20/alpha crystallin family protein [Fimbriimonadaceae bacterium]|nr:Hsp20/alpha crystallin family protein [Fimbriimonadaceae bacterium]
MSRQNIDEWLWQVGNELQRLSEEMVRTRPAVAIGKGWEPRVDVLEDANRILVKVEIAGVRGDEISLLYLADRHSLLIRGSRQDASDNAANRVGVHQLEIFYGEFQREVKLPDIPISIDEMKAQYRNGFLLIMLPKQQRVVVTKTVTIKKI